MVCINVVIQLFKRQYEATFTVRDGESGLPVPKAVVTLDGLSGETDASGQVTLGPFRKGTYSYTVKGPPDADYEDLTGSLSTP